LIDGTNNGQVFFSYFAVLPAGAPVPEPIPASLFGFSLLALGLKRRKLSVVQGNLS
jgi:hypothetical protein